MDLRIVSNYTDLEDIFILIRRQVDELEYENEILKEHIEQYKKDVQIIKEAYEKLKLSIDEDNKPQQAIGTDYKSA